MSNRLDRLLYDVNVGAKSQRDHDRFVGEAEAIADDMRAIFREPTPAQEAVNPPLWQQGGKAIW